MNKLISPANPGAEYLELKQEIDAAILKVLQSGHYILGEEVSLFEQEFANYLGVNNAVGVASGTDALVLSLKALDLEKDDEIITVSHTAVATVSSIIQCGLKPVFVDIDPVTYTMDVQKIENCISTKTRAILPVHLYGQPVDMQPLLEIAKKYNLYIIEDCAQAHGAEYEGKKVGSFGDISAFSFYPTKNLGAIGDGGLVATNNFDIYKKICLLREYGWKDRYISELHGFNSRLDEIQAAILRVKLKNLDSNNQKRRDIAAYYTSRLSTLLKVPSPSSEVKHVFHQFVIECENRNHLQQYLKKNQIITSIHYPCPVHMQPPYVYLDQANLRETEVVAGRVLSIPMYPQLLPSELDRITSTIMEYFNG